LCAGLILSVQSNQFVKSKTQIVQSNERNCAVQKGMIFKLCWLQDKQRRYKQTPKASQQEWLRRCLVMLMETRKASLKILTI